MAEAATPIRTLIVDDEPLAREGLRLLLGDDEEVEVIGECASGREAVQAIQKLHPDLVFLDVQMPELDGFQVIASLPPDDLPAVVFVTAYDRYALRAFEVHALDYLLKPFDDERFQDALKRAKRHLGLQRVSEVGQRRLAVKDVGRVVFLNVAEIDWIEAADYYVQLHAGKQSYLHRESMQSLEARLDPSQFLRIHRSAIVNVRGVKEVRHQGRRDIVVVLACGATLKVARSHREKLQRLR
jgi:two-component system LytT family response regulator